jgi:hypothetical protein
MSIMRRKCALGADVIKTHFSLIKPGDRLCLPPDFAPLKADATAFGSRFPVPGGRSAQPGVGRSTCKAGRARAEGEGVSDAATSAVFTLGSIITSYAQVEYLLASCGSSTSPGMR